MTSEHPPAVPPDAIEAAVAATRIVVLTGAGMSAESGVPTFRDALTGYWSTFEPERLATPQAFLADPPMVFGWYLSRIKALGAIEPHAGYGALVELERIGRNVTVVTQNVDGLHRHAGSSVVHELHGSLAAARCFEEGHPFPFERMVELAASADGAVEPPRCETCGGMIRPGVVWFGESLPPHATEAAWAAVQEAELVLLVGTSSVVYPAAQLPDEARAAGATVIEINPDETPFTPRAHVYWKETAGRALPALMEAVREIS